MLLGNKNSCKIRSSDVESAVSVTGLFLHNRFHSLIEFLLYCCANQVQFFFESVFAFCKHSIKCRGEVALEVLAGCFQCLCDCLLSLVYDVVFDYAVVLGVGKGGSPRGDYFVLFLFQFLECFFKGVLYVSLSVHRRLVDEALEEFFDLVGVGF
jgi:hypothetical protein